jgi:hypothetical protein
MCTLPWCLGGAALPHVDPKDPETHVMGIKKRVCVKPPKPNKIKLRKLRKFVRKVIQKLWVPLESTTDLTVETWLKTTTYTKKRKDHLLRVSENIVDRLDKKNFTVEGFIKDENYEMYKHARGIHARNDSAKVILGPIFKAIENKIFASKYFIKHIPKPKWSTYIKDLLYDPAAVYAASDYTSFESHFTKKIMSCIEFELYDYMTKDLPIYNEFMYIITHYLAGQNHIRYYFYNLILEATRMSGEMNTSLGNGFTNLMLLLFVFEESGYDWQEVCAVVEGDDALARVDPLKPLKVEIFEEVGFTIKIEIFEYLNEASFCGNIFDVEDGIIITNIMKAITKLGWTHSKFKTSKYNKRMGLLRSKALSMLYAYTGCPVLQALACRLIELTKNYRSVAFVENSYDAEEQFVMIEYMKSRKEFGLGLPYIEVPFNTRKLVEKLYNIPVNIQLMLEDTIKDLQLGELFDGNFLMLVPEVWKEYYQIYTVSTSTFGSLAPFDLHLGKEINEIMVNS